MSPARRAAFRILRRVEEESAYASPLLGALDDTNLSREDRALAQELTLGVLRWRKSLDHFIERYSGRTLARFDPPVLIAIRMGLYQIRYLSRIPESAAVNESVNLVKQAGLKSACGLVNAVLRRAAANKMDVAGSGISDPMERAAVEFSHPRWLLERWSATLGADQAIVLAASNNQRPQNAFRVNSLRLETAADRDPSLGRIGVNEVLTQLASQGITVRRSEIVPEGFVASGAALAVSRPAKENLIYLQDEASQLVSVLAEALPGQRILDLCAAPGSKTTHLADLTCNQAKIVAGDIHFHRLRTLVSTCGRFGADAVACVALDASSALPFGSSGPDFDRVLVDAPCSGTGTLRQNPEIKWRLGPEDIERLARLQSTLLANASEVVATGGRLVYSTCSLEPEEGEQVIHGFLKTGAPFRLIKPPLLRSDLVTPEGFVRTYPHLHGSDGFFVAVLEKL